MKSSPLSLPGRLVGLGVVLSLILVGNLRGQQLIDAEVSNQFAGKYRGQFNQKVLTGQESAKDPQLELASRYYVLRLTMVENVDPKKMYDVIREFEDMVGIITTSGNASKNRDVTSKFAPHLVNRFKEIFALDFANNRLVLINAAILLPQLAKLKQEEIGDFLTNLVADDKVHDAIRVHAVSGLREYFPVKELNKESTIDANFKQLVVRKDRDLKRVEALLKTIDRPKPPTMTDPYEIDGRRYVRREAVASLARAGVPALSAYTGKVEGPVALGLIKVLSKKTDPTPNIQERIEAAIGVCDFTKYVQEYDPRVGIHLVGECVIDMMGEYRKDYNNIIAKGKERKPTYLSWRIQSKRLEVALGNQTFKLRDTPAAKSALSLEAAAKPFLLAMYNSGQLEQDLAFRNLVKSLNPQTKTLFRAGKQSLLDFDWESAALEEEKQP